MDEHKITLRDRLEYLPHELRYQRSKRAENALSWVAAHLPRRLRYWTWLSVLARATTDQRLRRMEVPGIPLEDLLRVTHDQLGERRSRRQLERIAVAARELWDNRLGWSDGRRPYAPRQMWADLGEELGVDAELIAELRSGDELAPLRAYPYEEGDVVVLGPELFGLPDASVLCFRGVNYVPQTEGEQRLGMVSESREVRRGD